MAPPPAQYQVPAGLDAVPLDMDTSTPAMGARAAAPPAGGDTRKNVMTMMAGTAMGVSAAFNGGFKRPFAGWSAELAEPVGPSTGGGKQALQPITIISGAGERLTIGRVDPVRRAVTLRSYTTVSGMHGQRYNRAFPVSQADWDKFINTVTVFFKAMDFGVTEERYVPNVPVRSKSTDGDRSLLVIMLVLALTAIAILVWVLITR